MAENILVCTAWPYVNGSLHVGHLAGVYVPADTFARFQRLRGNNVLMVSGSDEHGTPITVRAEQEGVSPKEIADRFHAEFLGYWRDLGISYDLYTRTGTDVRRRVVQAQFLDLLQKEYLFQETVEAFYDETARRFLPDRYVEGTCPNCGYDKARGDQCDNCGKLLDPIQLINPRSRFSGQAPVVRETTHYFLDLPKLNDRLIEWTKPKTYWRQNAYRFTVNFVQGGLQPRAITRDLEWGVPIPLEGFDDKRIYVWFDAVIGYLSASVEWARRTGDPDAWRPFWSPGVDGRYFMGKDNVVFHSVIWPSILLGASGKPAGTPGEFGELALPTEVVSSEFLTMEGRKFSSSRSVVIYVRDVLERYGADPLRYYLAAAGPETSDTDFTWDQFVTRNNTELVAGWGNLVNRTVSMVEKNVGRVPEAGELLGADQEVLAASRAAFEPVGELLGRSQQKAALAEVMRVVADANKYLSDQAPWKLKDDPARRETVLHTALQLVDDAKTLLTPFLPESCERVHRMLGGEGTWSGQPELREVDDLDGGPGYPVLMGDYATEAVWESRPLRVGARVDKPVPLFRKLDPSVVDEELARLEAGA